MNEAKLIAFVGTEDPVRAREFYEEVLGLKLVAIEPSALVFNANGTMLRVSLAPGFEPAAFTVLGWDVADIKTKADELVQRGVNFERFPDLGQDEKGIATFPDGTQVAWFKDPDGNMLSLTQF
ncbi:MAG: VOC family protein [Candidatus Promineifilaceae bacterium]